MTGGDDMTEGFKALCLANGIGIKDEIRDAERVREFPWYESVSLSNVHLDLRYTDIGPDAPRRFALFLSVPGGWRGWEIECPSCFNGTAQVRSALAKIGNWIKLNPGFYREVRPYD